MRVYRLFQAKLLIELINTTAGIDQLLLACIKGVTLGTDLDLDVLLRASRFNNLTASAPYSGLLVIGMYPFLHSVHLFLCIFISLITLAHIISNCNSFLNEFLLGIVANANCSSVCKKVYDTSCDSLSCNCM